MEELLSVEINIDGDIPESSPVYWCFRSLQTFDPKVKLAILRDLNRLIEKYEQRSDVHIGR